MVASTLFSLKTTRCSMARLIFQQNFFDFSRCTIIINREFSDLFQQGYDDKIYGQDDFDQLSKLRKARNDVAHPEKDSRISFTAEDLRKWTSIVFRIIGEGKEVRK